MADVYNNTTKEYIKSANTTEYPREQGWFYDPDISDSIVVRDDDRGNTINIPSFYWDIESVDEDGNAVIVADKVAYFNETTATQLQEQVQHRVNTMRLAYDETIFELDTFTLEDLVSMYTWVNNLRDAVDDPIIWPDRDNRGISLSEVQFKELVEGFLRKADAIRSAYLIKVQEIKNFKLEDFLRYDIDSNWPE